MTTRPAWAPVAGFAGDPELRGDPVLAPLGMIGRDRENGAPKPPPCTASSRNTWRPTSPWPMSPIPWATAYRNTWKRNSGAT